MWLYFHIVLQAQGERQMLRNRLRISMQGYLDLNLAARVEIGRNFVAEAVHKRFVGFGSSCHYAVREFGWILVFPN